MTLHELPALFTSKNIEYTTANLDAVDQNAQLTDAARFSRSPRLLFVCRREFLASVSGKRRGAGAVAVLCQQSLAEKLVQAPNVLPFAWMTCASPGSRSRRRCGPPRQETHHHWHYRQKVSLPARICLRANSTATSRTPRGVIGGIEVFDGKDTQPAHNNCARGS